MFKILNLGKASLKAMLAVAMIATVSLTFAFKPFSKEKVETRNQVWYQYNSNTFSNSDVSNPLNYTKADGEPGCAGDANICSIQLIDTGNNPEFDSSIAESLVNAQNHVDVEPALNIRLKD